ncbi:MAG: ribosome-associated translation inhibitor RaiA [Lactobacillus sp.]|uniref:Ribosome hibernation promoting factor n=1 Tax=Bombilactobacillus bombi TaxID=1303590 RepID=A0A347SS07_9LACO|nr:ribosome-associated translation inhibitor RaiA [Bombilactobacillus bombi]MCO6541763.1 ribosome-associated translation inhibitor RaiA [Lactobacillus sp.]AXX64816.1 ribosome-associated translation inhibitor RaiA [Bombilactobacillus bombi]MCO6543274.1 ribosome-associated translation inhibitor RaiA [Lactobacillus sp.]RHW47373.1 ribosome-associated translation inhibitor RaiA [Bombilactobacillus bombi]RHW50143.1 ribosome-associated translation inhibitor RaiA [Bombilactobacillus bombi]
MLKINVRGENIEVTDAIRSYIEKRLGNLNKYFKDTENPIAHVNLKVYGTKSTKVEVTIPMPYLTLRAEKIDPDMYKGIDAVFEKLERQIRKFKTKINRKSREKGIKDFNLVGPSDTEAEASDDLAIVRTKHVSLKPMDAQEAVLQMDMLGHNFFVFEDAKTNGTSIVYKRNDGRYGLIETGE